jgi:hypothetical protein
MTLLVSRDEMLAFHKEATAKMFDTTVRKNADYAGAREGQNAFQNLSTCEHFDLTTTEVGIAVRMTDKFSRLCTLIKGATAKVKDESIEDTLLDFANYCILLACYLRHKQKVREARRVVLDPGLREHVNFPCTIPDPDDFPPRATRDALDDGDPAQDVPEAKAWEQGYQPCKHG